MIHEDDDPPSQQSWLSIGVKRLVDCEPLFILLMTCVGVLPVLIVGVGLEIQQSLKDASQSPCKNGMTQLGLAFYNYQAMPQTLSTPAVPDLIGEPSPQPVPAP